MLEPREIQAIRKSAEFVRSGIFAGNSDAIAEQNSNLEFFLEKNGIRVLYADLTEEDFDAFSRVVDARPEIVIDDGPNQRSRPRKVFSMAHELGHIVLHLGWLPNVGQIDGMAPDEGVQSIKYRGNADSNTREEQFADRFAAEFLMPFNDVQPIVGTMQASNATENEIANRLEGRYYVSHWTAVFRIREINAGVF